MLAVHSAAMLLAVMLVTTAETVPLQRDLEGQSNKTLPRWTPWNEPLLSHRDLEQHQDLMSEMLRLEEGYAVGNVSGRSFEEEEDGLLHQNLDDDRLPRPEWNWEAHLQNRNLKIGDVIFSYHPGQAYIKFPETLQSFQNDIEAMFDWDVHDQRCHEDCKSDGVPVTHAAVVIDLGDDGNHPSVLESRAIGLLETPLETWMIGQAFFSVMRFPDMMSGCSTNSHTLTKDFVNKIRSQGYKYSRNEAIRNFAPKGFRHAVDKYLLRIKKNDEVSAAMGAQNSMDTLPKVWFCTKLIAWYYFYIGCPGFDADTDLNMWPKKLRCHMCRNQFDEVSRCKEDHCGCPWCIESVEISTRAHLTEPKLNGLTDASATTFSSDKAAYDALPNKNMVLSLLSMPRVSSSSYFSDAMVDASSTTAFSREAEGAISSEDFDNQGAVMDDIAEWLKIYGDSETVAAPGGVVNVLWLIVSAFLAVWCSFQVVKTLNTEEALEWHMYRGAQSDGVGGTLGLVAGSDLKRTRESWRTRKLIAEKLQTLKNDTRMTYCQELQTAVSSKTRTKAKMTWQRLKKVIGRDLRPARPGTGGRIELMEEVSDGMNKKDLQAKLTDWEHRLSGLEKLESKVPEKSRTTENVGYMTLVRQRKEQAAAIQMVSEKIRREDDCQQCLADRGAGNRDTEACKRAADAGFKDVLKVDNACQTKISADYRCISRDVCITVTRARTKHTGFMSSFTGVQITGMCDAHRTCCKPPTDEEMEEMTWEDEEDEGNE